MKEEQSMIMINYRGKKTIDNMDVKDRQNHNEISENLNVFRI